MADKKILLGLTTTPNSDWRAKVKEIDTLGLKEIALFPTFLKTTERKELYRLLEQTALQSIPHVHIRTEDMDLEEIAYLSKKYKAEVFNIHSAQDYPINFDYSDYKVYWENTRIIPTEEELEKYDGLCIDFSHWENYTLLNSAEYLNFEKLVKKFSCKIGHISAIKKQSYPNSFRPSAIRYASSHWMKNLSELDYIKKYIKYLPDIISIELENSFKEQLKAKAYLEKIINQ